MPDNHIDDELIVGLDIITQSKLTMTNKGITMEKLYGQQNEKSNMDYDIPKLNNSFEREIKRLNRIHYIGLQEQVEPELSHINNKMIVNQIKLMIENYKPSQQKKCPIEMEIILSDEIPIATKPKRLATSEKLEIDKQINEWLNNDIIQPSCSDFSANLIIVPKKDGSKRLCVDYRRINSKIIRDRFPMPLIEDQLDQLQTGTIFTTLDLANGFHHVPIKQEDEWEDEEVPTHSEF